MAEDASGNNTAEGSQTPEVAGGAGGNPASDTSANTAETPATAAPDEKLEGPSIGVLNRRASKRIKKEIDPDFTSIWGQIAAVTDEVFKEATDQGSGPWRGICLTGPQTNLVNTAGFATKDEYNSDNNPHLAWIFGEHEAGLSASKLIQIRARIPEIHMHLPVPKDDKDWAVISMYPVFTAESENTNNGVVPNPGEIVIVEFGDKANKQDGVFLTAIKETQSRSAGAGQSNCPPPAPPASMGAPAQGGVAPVDLGSQGPINTRLKATQPGQKAVIFGDSQCQGGMGKKISKYLKDEMGYELIVPGSEYGNAKFKSGGGRTWARHSSKASEWIKPGPSSSDTSSYSNYRKGTWHMLEPMFAQKPALVAIIGGGNGASAGHATNLINKIRSVAGNCAIAWFSAPLGVPTRAQRALGGDRKFNGGPGNWTPKDSWKESRERVIDLIGSEVKALPNTIFVKTPDLTPRYNKYGCGGCDGIHMPSKNAEELIGNIKAAGSPTPGGENLDFLNSMKNVIAGFATGLKKALKDLAALQTNLKTQMSQMSLEQAKANMKQTAEKLGISEDQIKNRDWYSGYEPEHVQKASQVADPPGTTLPNNWSPPTYFELAKMYGFQAPDKISLGENITEMEARHVSLLESGDPDAVQWATNYYSGEIQKAKQLWEQMGDVNMSLPGEPFPADGDQIKSLQIEMALRINVAKDKTKPAEPAQPAANPGPTPNCGNAHGGDFSAGPLPTVNIGAVQFKEGPLTPEEMLAYFMGFGKKFGYTKYEMCLLAACCKNESGPIHKNKNRTGTGCTVRLEPHVSARNIGSSCSWACCHSSLSGNPCADGTKGWRCKGDGNFPGAGWSGVRRCVASHPGEKCYESLTPGIAQSFWVSKFRRFENQPLGNNASEYVEILRRSHAAQIFAMFAFIETKLRLRRAIRTLNIPATARYYNGAKSSGGKLSGYGARLELYCRGKGYRDSMPLYNWGARKPKDSASGWYTTAPPSNSAAETAARNMTTEYSLAPELFLPLASIGTDVILAQYDSFQPTT